MAALQILSMWRSPTCAYQLKSKLKQSLNDILSPYRSINLTLDTSLFRRTSKPPTQQSSLKNPARAEYSAIEFRLKESETEATRGWDELGIAYNERERDSIEAGRERASRLLQAFDEKWRNALKE